MADGGGSSHPCDPRRCNLQARVSAHFPFPPVAAPVATERQLFHQPLYLSRKKMDDDDYDMYDSAFSHRRFYGDSPPYHPEFVDLKEIEESRRSHYRAPRSAPLPPIPAPPAAKVSKCNVCGAIMIVRHGRYGAFLACPHSTRENSHGTRSLPMFGVPTEVVVIDKETGEVLHEYTAVILKQVRQ